MYESYRDTLLNNIYNEYDSFGQLFNEANGLVEKSATDLVKALSSKKTDIETQLEELSSATEETAEEVINDFKSITDKIGDLASQYRQNLNGYIDANNSLIGSVTNLMEYYDKL